jgi:hypothetical protein
LPARGVVEEKLLGVKGAIIARTHGGYVEAAEDRIAEYVTEISAKIAARRKCGEDRRLNSQILHLVEKEKRRD